MSKKRKIIEVYATENKKDGTISFDFERCEDTKIANALMKKLCWVLSLSEHDNYDLEVVTEEE